MVEFLKSVLNFIFPPTCIICDSNLFLNDGLCSDCLNELNFITKPFCNCCGYPFDLQEYEVLDSFLCGKCLAKHYKFDMARSVLCYNDISKKIILPFKHADKTAYKNFIAKLMINAGADLLKDTDIIIPVPIHFSRLLKRKYNQATLLSNIISVKTKIPVCYDILFRIKKTKSQGHLTTKQRQANVLNAFAVKNADKIKGKKILLIDDVFTSGATLNECAKILKKNGAGKVYVLTFARVVHNVK